MVQSLNFSSYYYFVVSPRMMSRWRKIIQILSLQWFRVQEVNDVVNSIPDDDDVLTEQHLVHSGRAESDRIVIRNLSKVYENGKVAVNNLSIGIAPGECFGLLGINGKLQ
jgi:ATP-binding cassette, subfamily A (ABC1), member 3